MTDPPDRDVLGCELLISPHGSQLALAFALSNAGAEARTIRYVDPFLQFELQVSAGGRDLAVEQPDIDVPSRPQELVVPAGGRATLDTPIRLRFAADQAAADPMVWTIRGPRAAVELRARLTIEGEAIAPCAARYEPADAP